jgi:hypothetical protein
MKTVVAIVFAVLAVLGLSLAAGRDAPDRPPGIAADRWAPISDTLGFVLVPDSKPAALPPLSIGATGQPGRIAPRASIDRMAPVIAPGDPTGLFAAPSPAVQAIIEEGQPVRGYIMVKRGKVWRPLAVVPPTVDE